MTKPHTGPRPGSKGGRAILGRRWAYAILGALVVAVGAGFIISRSFSAEETTVAALTGETHFHGIAVAPGEAARLFLATHHGFYQLTPDGKATRVSQTRDDLMGFTPHPTDRGVLYASGHPASGGNLGFMSSSDGGRSWTKLSNGAGGPVDFHQMDVSKADPKVIYGSYGDLQRSADGGRSWSRIGPAPDGLIALAASARAADTVYAATRNGLLVSRNAGRQWMPAHGARQAATMVHSTGDATVYAFIAGTGLVRAAEPGLDWQVVSNGFGRRVVLHLAVASAGGSELFAIAFDPESRAQSLLASRDGGKSWSPLGGT